jgi:hypothetical protein
MKALTALVGMLLLISPCRADDTPQWPDFDGLFGNTAESNSVRDFLQKFKLKLGQAKAEHEIVGPHDSYTVMFRNQKVECIVLSTKSWRWPEGELVATYNGKLPFGLRPSDIRADMYQRYGKESGVVGCGQWDFQGHQIAPVFSDKNPSSSLESVYISKP